MAESRPNPEPSKENAQAPIDPDVAAEAVKVVNEAMAILPKRRFGCLGRFAKYGVVLLALLAAFVYWNFLRRPPLKISKDTTYITQPLTSDGTRVDYFAALEAELDLPEMQADDNGYRLLFRALGDAQENRRDAARSAQIAKKLGLDAAIKPTMTFIETYEFFQNYCKAEGLDEKQVVELDAKVHEPWTLEELPMMEPWLEKNGPVLDVIAQAVRKPAFCIPLVRSRETRTLAESLTMDEWSRTRSFARMLLARANYRFGTGDIDGGIDDVVTCKRLGRHVQRQGTLIARLVGIAIEGISDSIGVAAIRETQPSEEQLNRFVDELNTIPPRLDLDRMWELERHYTLDSLQSMALDGESLGGLFSGWEHLEEFKPPMAAHISVDWNIVMRRMNLLMEDWDTIHMFQPPSIWSPSNLLIGVRSRRVGDAMAGMTMPSFQATLEANRRSHCAESLRRIALAMLLYERRHGTLPPAYTVDADSKPLHSWRVLLLPYLGEEELFGKLRLDESWDSEHNRRFHEAALTVYQCPSAALGLGQTHYSVVVGEKTAFQAGQSKTLEQFGMNLILVVERKQAVCWMDPASELVETIAVEGINRRDDDGDGLGSLHPGGIQVGLRNGSARFISETIDHSVLRGLLDGTTEGQEF